MRAMGRGSKYMLAMCTGLVIIIVACAAVALFAPLAVAEWAGAMSTLATLAWMTGWLVFVIVWDSRRRWPNCSASERAYRLFTFRR